MFILVILLTDVSKHFIFSQIKSYVPLYLKRNCLGKKSLQLRSKLVKSAQNNLSFWHLKVVFQSPYKLRTLFHFKDILDKKICSDLVQRFSCSSCNATYYGNTYQHFFTRAAKLMGVSNLIGKRVKNVKSQQFLATYYNVIAQ